MKVFWTLETGGRLLEQIREVIESPYRIIYYIKPDRIDVLAVIHSARSLEA